jgi:hypothetical protein
MLAGEFPLSQSNKAANKLPVESTTALSLALSALYYLQNIKFHVCVVCYWFWLHKQNRTPATQTKRKANKKYLHWGGGFSFSDG